MGKRKSAGILLYRIQNKELQFFLIHHGGPFWKNKDAGAWSIPKGEYDDNEQPLTAARREFEEETGSAINGDFIALTPIVQKAGKEVSAWAVAGDIDATTIKSNMYKIEWPPKSGRYQQYPEVDKAGWFNMDEALQKINAAQVAFINELSKILSQQ